MRKTVAGIALAALLPFAPAGAASLGSVVADFSETLDLNPTYAGPLVLQDLDASAADSPDLDPSEVLANPSLYQGALAVDLAEDTGLLTLTPSSDTCYATIDVVIGNMRFESSQVDGLVLREKRAFLVDDEGSPFFVRTAVFTKSGIAIDHAFLVLDLRCPLDLAPAATSDVYEVNPEPAMHDDFAGARFDFRETLATSASDPTPRILFAGDRTPGAGAELTEADEQQDPANHPGALEVDLDPATGRLVLTPTASACYSSILVEPRDFVPAERGVELTGAALVSAGAFDDPTTARPSFLRTVSFTDRALSIDYRDLGGGCDLHLGTGADTYQLFVPEPGGFAAAVAAVGALVVLRRRGCWARVIAAIRSFAWLARSSRSRRFNCRRDPQPSRHRRCSAGTLRAVGP